MTTLLTPISEQNVGPLPANVDEDVEPDAQWKESLRARIEQNLRPMVDKAREDRDSQLRGVQEGSVQWENVMKGYNFAMDRMRRLAQDQFNEELKIVRFERSLALGKEVEGQEFEEFKRRQQAIWDTIKKGGAERQQATGAGSRDSSVSTPNPSQENGVPSTAAPARANGEPAPASSFSRANGEQDVREGPSIPHRDSRPLARAPPGSDPRPRDRTRSGGSDQILGTPGSYGARPGRSRGNSSVFADFDPTTTSTSPSPYDQGSLGRANGSSLSRTRPQDIWLPPVPAKNDPPPASISRTYAHATAVNASPISPNVREGPANDSGRTLSRAGSIRLKERPSPNADFDPSSIPRDRYGLPLDDRGPSRKGKEPERPDRPRQPSFTQQTSVHDIYPRRSDSRTPARTPLTPQLFEDQQFAQQPFSPLQFPQVSPLNTRFRMPGFEDSEGIPIRGARRSNTSDQGSPENMRYGSQNPASARPIPPSRRSLPGDIDAWPTLPSTSPHPMYGPQSPPAVPTASSSRPIPRPSSTDDDSRRHSPSGALHGSQSPSNALPFTGYDFPFSSSPRYRYSASPAASVTSRRNSNGSRSVRSRASRQEFWGPSDVSQQPLATFEEQSVASDSDSEEDYGVDLDDLWHMRERAELRERHELTWKLVRDEQRRREREEMEITRKAEQARRLEEEARRKEEDARRKEEEARRKEEEARRKEEDARKKADEARRKEEEVRLKAVEIQQKQEELARREAELHRREVEAKLQEEIRKREEAEARLQQWKEAEERRKQEEAERQERERREKEERETRERSEREEREAREKEERERREREEKERRQKEEKERREREKREKAEREKREREERERRERDERERKEKEKRDREEKERLEREEKAIREKEEKERRDREDAQRRREREEWQRQQKEQEERFAREREAWEEARRREAEAAAAATAQARLESERLQAERRAAIEAQRQREEATRRQREVEAQRQREVEAQKQREEAELREAEAQRQRELEEQQQLEAEAEAKRQEAEEQRRQAAEEQRLREAEEQRLREAEEQRREAEEQRLREIEAQRQEEETRRQEEARRRREKEKEERLERARARQREEEARKHRETEATQQREAEAARTRAAAAERAQAEAAQSQAQSSPPDDIAEFGDPTFIREQEAELARIQAHREREREARELATKQSEEEEARKREAAKKREEEEGRRRAAFVREQEEAYRRAQAENEGRVREMEARKRAEDALRRKEQQQRQQSEAVLQEAIRRSEEEYRMQEERRRRQDSVGSASDSGSTRPGPYSSTSSAPRPIPKSSASSAPGDRSSSASSSSFSSSASFFSASSARSNSTGYTSSASRTSSTPTASATPTGMPGTPNPRGWKSPISPATPQPTTATSTASSRPTAGAYQTAYSASSYANPSQGTSRPTASYSANAPLDEEEWARRQHEQARRQFEQFQREQEVQQRLSEQKAMRQLSKEEVIKLFEEHERRWARIPSLDFLSWHSFPWPMLKQPNDPEQLTYIEIQAYVLSPHQPADKTPRERIKDYLRKWHPDRFETKLLPKVREDDREEVKEGAGAVARHLNKLLGSLSSSGENGLFG